MSAHTKEEFDVFMSQLLETNATLGFYCDFDKIKSNVAEVELSLTSLNFLLGKDDLSAAVNTLWQRDRLAFEVLPILIAVRKSDNKKVVTTDGAVVPISDYLTSPEGVLEYLDKTGLAKLFKDRTVKNLTDYVLGVEAGLDSHARKNRSGHVMEHLVADIFDRNGIHYNKEVYSSDFPAVHAALDGDKKRFDFVIPTQKRTYLIEVNFYSDGGSKPNEVARAYTELAPKIDALDGYEFVWITDGKGWTKAKSMFTAAYMAIPNVFNLSDVNKFVLRVKNDGQSHD